MNYLNIEKETLKNKNYRKVIHTTDEQQLVLMSLNPGEDIPPEIHEDTTQFFRIEQGEGIAIVNKKVYVLENGIALTVPPNTSHYIKQIGSKPLKLYTIYSPPEHPKNRVNVRQPQL